MQPLPHVLDEVGGLLPVAQLLLAGEARADGRRAVQLVRGEEPPGGRRALGDAARRRGRGGGRGRRRRRGLRRGGGLRLRRGREGRRRGHGGEGGGRGGVPGRSPARRLRRSGPGPATRRRPRGAPAAALSRGRSWRDLRSLLAIPVDLGVSARRPGSSGSLRASGFLSFGRRNPAAHVSSLRRLAPFPVSFFVLR